MESRLARVIFLLAGIFLAGAAIAFLITLLFAPRSGKQTRQRIANFAKNTAAKQRKMAQKLSKKGRRALEQEKPKNWFKKLVA